MKLPHIELVGTVLSITPIGKTGNTVTILLECEMEYKDDIGVMIYPLNTFGDRASTFAEKVGRGARIKCDCIVKGREWEGKHFTNVDLYKYEVIKPPEPDPQPQPAPYPEDDLPF
jgi:hypothetical protein